MSYKVFALIYIYLPVYFMFSFKNANEQNKNVLSRDSQPAECFYTVLKIFVNLSLNALMKKVLIK